MGFRHVSPNDCPSQKTCFSKQRFAEDHARRLNQRHPDEPTLRAYQCPYCRAWHLTKRRYSDAQVDSFVKRLQQLEKQLKPVMDENRSLVSRNNELSRKLAAAMEQLQAFEKMSPAEKKQRKTDELVEVLKQQIATLNEKNYKLAQIKNDLIYRLLQLVNGKYTDQAGLA